MIAAASQGAAPAAEPMNESGGWLDDGWVVLPAEALPGLPGKTRPGVRRFVLLHAVRGMAILDLWSEHAASRDAEGTESLEAELTLAGFLRRFDPRLPMRRIHLAQSELPRLAGVVARSYAGEAPLELPKTWMDAVRSTLAVPEDATAPAARRMARRRMAGRYRLAAGIAALVTAGAIGALATGGHDPAPLAPAPAEASPLPVAAPPTALAAAVPEPVPPTAFAAAVPEPVPPEPASLPAVDPGTASAEPPEAAMAEVTVIPPEPPQDMAPAAAEPAPTAPLRPAGRRARVVRRAAPPSYSQGWMPNSSGSFIREQSRQYAGGNGG